MFHDKVIRGPVDRSRLSTTDNYEMAQWTNHFGEDASQLRDLWTAVGAALRYDEAHEATIGC